MKFFGDKKLLSKERVLGISLADILLQAVFLLFIALVIGYEDPLILLQIEQYAQVGKDLCDKKHAGPSECRDDIKKEDLYIEVGKKLCSGKYPNAQKCIEAYIDAAKFKEKHKGSLAACMPIEDGASGVNIKTKPAVEMKILSSTQFMLVAFTPAYKSYLTNSGDNDRLALVNALEANGKQIFTINQVEEKFGFMRQSDCYQTPRTSTDIPMQHAEYLNMSSTINRVISSLKKPNS